MNERGKKDERKIEGKIMSKNDSPRVCACVQKGISSKERKRKGPITGSRQACFLSFLFVLS